MTSLSPADTVQFMLNPSNLRYLVEFCRNDAGGIMTDMVRARFKEAALLEELGLFYQAPVSPRTGEFPIDWMAYQIGLFDNGGDQRDKRGRERTTKTRFAFDIKVWAGPDPSFRANPDWQATCAFWTRNFALSHVGKLAKRGSLTPDCVVECLAALENIDDDWLFGIPLKRGAGSGSRYMSDHMCLLHLENDSPVSCIVSVGSAVFSIDEFSTTDPSGKPLTKAIGAARISRTPLPYWETQTL